MNHATTLDFKQPAIAAELDALTSTELDLLEFGVIGFDAQGLVQRYNAVESKLASLPAQRVLGHALFTTVAPCMNNYMVAQRFEDAAASATELDVSLDYVLTLRMRPEKVTLRLLCAPRLKFRYVLVMRRT